MARGPQHSNNWGGRREGAGGGGHSLGGRKKGGANRMTQKAIDMAAASPIHPLEFLLAVVSDSAATTKDRLFASSAALPYCLSRKATEVIVHNELEQKSVNELETRLRSIRVELKGVGVDVIEGELAANG